MSIRRIGAESTEEEYYCNFGVNPQKVPLLRTSALRISGSDVEGEIRVVELAGHPYFLAALFASDASTKAGPHPLVLVFVEAVLAAPTSACEVRTGQRSGNALHGRRALWRGEMGARATVSVSR